MVRFPAGPQVSLKCGDQSRDNGAGHKKNTMRSSVNPGPALCWRNDKSEVNWESSWQSDMDMRPLLVLCGAAAHRWYSSFALQRPKAVPAVSPWSLCVNDNLGGMEANLMAGRALFGGFQLPDGPRRCAIFLVEEKVMQGTSRSTDFRAYRRIAPKSLELLGGPYLRA